MKLSLIIGDRAYVLNARRIVRRAGPDEHGGRSWELFTFFGESDAGVNGTVSIPIDILTQGDNDAE